ncbi:hypothetical protein GUITHDRAFT_138206 [Guillardia theta CCMP2712]|uniref:Uncharacterized protein n=1 Tax=Guillardia theta (strain CCMP2712) TaxID=905079 RepID=L1JDT0_GUITC|nr:hypothetical protein GUITHDRAFT_138206 [Guillardia theta CCMP2712]EKX46462.1 hypothetical protein GUITHDRAFT_138206 [Guillardia theta CCMP2712]|eukprot:XP_005833442.1 hypothetical protein GUITHDRAFT_138206 [Guillardia theta CCMP2712]
MKREYLDPDTITPRLPLPYRMIDNLIRSLVEEALEQTRDDKEQEKAIDSVSAVFEYHQRKDIILSQASSDGLLVFVCTSSGSLECINSLRGAQVGEPIVLGEPATCLTLSSDGRALAVGLRSKVNILQVMKDSPFLKHLLSIETRGVPKNLAFSSDSTVFVVISEAEELELFRIALPEVPVVEEEEEAKNTSSEASGEKKEEAEGEELVPTMKDPVRVLRLKCSREKCKKMFFLGLAPKIRRVGELTGRECRHLNIVNVGTNILERFDIPLKEWEDAEGSEAKGLADVSITLPNLVTTGAMDDTTAMLIIGMKNGSSIIWNNLLNSHHATLKKHKGAVTCCAFTGYSSDKEAVRAITCSEDNSIYIHNPVDGSIHHVYRDDHLRAIDLVCPTTIPIFLLASVSLHQVWVFSIDRKEVAATLKMPSDTLRANINICTTGGLAGELLPVLSLIQKPAVEEGGEGEKEVTDDSEAPKAEEESTLLAYRLIDVLKIVYPDMVRKPPGQWMQTSAEETYWQQRMPAFAGSEAPAVSETYLRRQVSSSEAGQPKRRVPSPSPLFSPTSRGDDQSDAEESIAGDFAVEEESNWQKLKVSAIQRCGLVSCCCSYLSLLVASRSSGALADAGSGGGRPPSARKDGGSTPVLGKAQRLKSARKEKEVITLAEVSSMRSSIAERSYNDHVEIVMQELRKRQEERLTLKAHRKKRAEEILTSFNG